MPIPAPINPGKEPYLSKLVAIAGQLLGQGRMVIVLEHGRSILLLPDRIIDLGILDAQDQIGLDQVSTPAGPAWAAYRVARDGGRQWLSGPISQGKTPAGISGLQD